MAPKTQTQHDPGLRWHRITNYIITALTGLLTSVAAANWDDWVEMQKQVYSLRDVPADIREIKTAMTSIQGFVEAQMEVNKRHDRDIERLQEKP